jgi:hypothetical protein
MTSSRRGAVFAALVLALATVAIADDTIPPLPRVGKSNESGPPNPPFPEMHSPCTFDMDADWLKPLKTTQTDAIKIKVPRPINCDGAVIKSVLAKGGGSVTTFQFTVAFRSGSDREGIISFGILDDDKKLVALGEASDNLDQDADSFLSGELTIKNKEFDRVFAKGQKPLLRITLRVEDN